MENFNLTETTMRQKKNDSYIDNKYFRIKSC